MGAFRKMENRLRYLRDRFIVGKLARSRLIRRQVAAEFDAVIAFLEDYCLAFDPRDGVIGAEIQKNGGWFLEETVRVLNALNEIGRLTAGKVFVDIGANIGTQTLYALRFGHFDRAVCFEPEPRNVRLLRTNAILNGVEDRIHIVPAAAGDKPGEVAMSISRYNSGAHSLRVRRGDDYVKVKVVTVNEKLFELGISADQVGLIWVDTEGYEPEVISGASCLVEKKRPIVFEFNPAVYPCGGERLLTFVAANYEVGAVLRKGTLEWKPARHLASMPFAEQVNLVFA